jgi:hypothetical protein
VTIDSPSRWLAVHEACGGARRWRQDGDRSVVLECPCGASYGPIEIAPGPVNVTAVHVRSSDIPMIVGALFDE